MESVVGWVTWSYRRAGIAALCVSLIAAFGLALAVGHGTASAAEPSVLVKVAPGKAAKTLAERHGLQIKRGFRSIGWTEFVAGKTTPGTASASAVERLSIAGLNRDPLAGDVEFARPGEGVEFHFTPSDPVFDTDITFSGSETTIGWHFYSTNFPSAWDIETGKSSVRIAIIDSEFDTDNPDLRDKLVDRRNLASGTPGYRTSDVKLKPGDKPHGSHVAGLASAASDNGIGVAGACLDCSLIGIKIGSEGAGTSISASFVGDIIEGIEYAISKNAKVINMSLGVTRRFDSLKAAVDAATSKGIVLVASAGNGQQTNPGAANYPASFPGVIGVGATEPPRNEIAPFSTHGSHVDVAAPGHPIVSTTDPSDPEAQSLDGEVAIAVKSGTSMSAPIVAGLAGLMLSEKSSLPRTKVEQYIKDTATDVGIRGKDPIYGSGVIDARKALEKARSYKPPAPKKDTEPKPETSPQPQVVRHRSRSVMRIFRRAKRPYMGRLVSSRRCKAARPVQLRMRTRRGIRVVARGRTNRAGVFVMNRSGVIPRPVFAHVPHARRGPVICLGSRTSMVRPGAGRARRR